MNKTKEIAENIVESYYNHGPNFTLDFEDAAKIARAYLELEKQFEAALVEIQHLKENNNVPAHMLKFGLKEGVEYE